jgi:hypothetical protein
MASAITAFAEVSTTKEITMKIAAAIVIILALVIGILPQFTDCQSQGKAIALPNGKTIPMKCHWTAQSEIAMAVPLFGLGIVMGVVKRKESRRILAGIGALLGLFVILLPTVLVGVCASADMLCNSVMKPTLILSGILIIAISIVTLVMSERQPEQNA